MKAEQVEEAVKKIKRKLTDKEKESCEGEIKAEEIAKIKKKMASEKAAGVDGIPVEFWKKYDFLDEWLATVFNEAIREGKMTMTMRMAVVKLIFKKKDARKMSNYRPISVLCADYKMMAKIVAERMKKVLTSVIDNDQQGFIKDGDITGNLILVKEIIEFCNESGGAGAVLMMDFKKAYDRVSRETMVRVLKEMNFGEGLLRIVETMYNEVGARIEVNGQLTEELQTGGGVRQGCPLSPYLFICVLEIMAISVRENEKIEGIVEPESGKEFKISLFADDAAIMWGSQRNRRKKRERTWRRMRK